ncbi:monocarboxylate transporter 5-like [Mytilus edulis]|uniref:monocarboxylate transporter 5-like n=1 Tax=Mytilus edulis TaxID=6550 RepID=UPI0039EF1C84
METDNLPIDRGWAWVILFAAVTTNFLYVGTLKSFGIFFVEILAEFQESVSVTSLINGIQTAMYCTTSLPVLLFFMNKIGARTLVFIGSLTISIGYGISSLAPNVDFLFFSISVVVGVGSSFLFAPSLVVIGQYFDKRRGMATGLAMSGGCLGSLVLPPFYQYLIDTYGLRGALLLTSGLLFNTTAMSGLLRPLDFYKKQKKDLTLAKPTAVKNGAKYISINRSKHENNANGNRMNSNIVSLNGEQFSGSHPVLSKSFPHAARAKAKMDRMRTFSETNKRFDKCEEVSTSRMSLSSFYKYLSIDDIANMSIISVKELKGGHEGFDSSSTESQNEKCCRLDLSVFKNPSYVLFLFVHILATLSPALVPSFLPVYLKENGLSKQEIVINVAVVGAADFVGRILCGYFADKPWIKIYHIIMVTQGLAGLVINCSGLFKTFWPLVAFSALFGISAGGIFGVVVTMIISIIGMENFRSGYAFLIITQGPVIAISAPIFGYLRDVTGSYNASFHFVGIASLLAVILSSIGVFLRRYKKTEKANVLDLNEEKESLHSENDI